MLVNNSIRDAVLLLTRVLLGAVLIAHGWQKYGTNGLAATSGAFEKMGVPLPGLSAAVAGGIELAGGTLLMLGLLTPIAGLAVAANMAGAFWFVHKDAGVFAADGGWELVAVIAVAALQLAVVGAGRFSLDHILFGRRRDSLAAPSDAPTSPSGAHVG